MNTTFEKSANTTDEWYTPKEIIDALGKFDLDPCAPVNPLWQTAEIMYNKNQDGLTKKWIGRVWLNPPYLIAFGENNAEILKNCDIAGKYVRIN